MAGTQTARARCATATRAAAATSRSVVGDPKRATARRGREPARLHLLGPRLRAVATVVCLMLAGRPREVPRALHDEVPRCRVVGSNALGGKEVLRAATASDRSRTPPRGADTPRRGRRAHRR